MMRAMDGLVAGLIALALCACDPPAENPPAPAPERHRNQPGTSRVGGTVPAAWTLPFGRDEPADPWLWLEELKGKRALRWVRAHNLKTRRVLEGDPRFDLFKKQALGIFTAPDRIPYGRYRNGFVYNFWRDETHVRGIYRRTTLASYRSDSPEWETLLDLDKLATAEGRNWVLKGIGCLPPAHEHCLIALSRGGRDRIVVREWNAATRTFVKDGFNIGEGYSQVAWLDADSVLVSSFHGRSLFAAYLFGYRDQVRVWKRGTPLDEAVPLLEADVQTADIAPMVAHRPDGNVAVIMRQYDFYNAEYFAITEAGKMAKLPVPRHAKLGTVFKGQILFILRKSWTPEPDGGEAREIPQGALIAFDLNAFMETGKLPEVEPLYVPDERSTVRGVSAARDAAILSLLNDVSSELMILRFENGEWRKHPAAIPEAGTAAVTSADGFSNVTFVGYQNFLTPDRLLQLDVDTGEVTPLKSLPARFDADGLAVKRLEATSRDGTGVPYFFVGPDEAERDGPLPTLLYGYGGFGISLTPGYLARFGKLWLERGGAFVIANIRGGGEFGPDWRRAGVRTNRQNSFDDFIAVSEDLIERGFTSPRRLGIMGGSNGGLLVGVALTQRPDLYNAVICIVPLLDMIRFVKLPPGQIWISEYGDPSDPKERKVLMSYSPYHNLEKETDYPGVFFLTSTADDRVHPGHARKMAARMESMGHEVLFFENIEGGHSASANLLQEAHNTALQFVYLARQLMDGEAGAKETAAAGEAGTGSGGE